MATTNILRCSIQYGAKLSALGLATDIHGSLSQALIEAWCMHIRSCPNWHEFNHGVVLKRVH